MSAAAETEGSEATTEAELRAEIARQRRRPRGGGQGVLMMAGVAVACAVLLQQQKASTTTTTNRLEVVDFDASQLFRVLSPKEDKTYWAVFFYKEYCGACRRVRPFFHALASTTNTTALRFGEIECVKFRQLCKHAGAKSQPMIKIFHKGKDLASWQGVLIAYEVFGWFLSLEGGAVLPEELKIEWPTDEALSEKMRDFKASNDQRVDRATSKTTTNPGLYLEAVDRARRFSLHDAVFASSSSSDVVLRGDALNALSEWLHVLAYALPLKEWRQTAESLAFAVQKSDALTSANFEAALRKAQVDEPTDFEVVAPLCRRRDSLYPCSLWILFHTLLANSDRHAAPHVLKGIRGFVKHFFGCSECAAHFDMMYDSDGGDDVQDAMDANIWLWKAHNSVSHRLLGEEEEEESKGELHQQIRAPWPDQASCRACFKEYHVELEEEALKKARSRKSKDPLPEPAYPEFQSVDKVRALKTWDPAVYDEGFVFQYLAETYCFDSDTFVCAAFDDPSRFKKYRRRSSRSTT